MRYLITLSLLFYTILTPLLKKSIIEPVTLTKLINGSNPPTPKGYGRAKGGENKCLLLI